MPTWTPVVTWILIALGWAVAYRIALTIANNNNKRSDLNKKKDLIVTLINEIIEDNISYWSDKKTTSLGTLIMYKLTRLSDEIETVPYSQTQSSQLHHLYIKYKQNITLNDEFLTPTVLSESDKDLLLQEAISSARELEEAIKKLV